MIRTNCGGNGFAMAMRATRNVRGNQDQEGTFTGCNGAEVAASYCALRSAPKAGRSWVHQSCVRTSDDCMRSKQALRNTMLANKKRRVIVDKQNRVLGRKTRRRDVMRGQRIAEEPKSVDGGQEAESSASAWRSNR